MSEIKNKLIENDTTLILSISKLLVSDFHFKLSHSKHNERFSICIII